MDIKLKNISDSKWAKVLAVIIVWLSFLAIMGSCLFLLENRNYASISNYNEDFAFQNDFINLVHNTAEYAQTMAGNMQPSHPVENQLPATVNFIYYVRNTQTGETWTNLDEERLTNLSSKTVDPIRFIQQQPTTAFLNARTIDSSIPLASSLAANIGNMMAGSPYEVYAAIVDPLQPGDILYTKYMNYIHLKTGIVVATILSIIAFILMAAAFAYLIYTTWRRNPEQDGQSRVEGMYTDVHTVLVLIAAFISLFVGVGFSRTMPKVLIIAGIAVVLSLDVFIGLFYILSIVRHIKAGQLFTNTLLYKLYSEFKASLQSAFRGKIFKEWLLLLLMGYGLINGLIFMLCLGNGAALLLFIAFNAGVVYFAARSLAALVRIMEAVKEISAGNLDYALDSTGIPVSFAAFADDIRSLQGGLQKAVVQAVKGERMKTDLITNVSHDLKTPLTSIINYVDLLQKENLDNEAAAGYVAILEEKSARLKQLIEDLTEASKASSGSLAVTGEKVNLQELMMQAGGEYQEKMRQAQLDLHMPAAGEAVVVWADGRHMWRIAENLLSNVLKYSLPHSRIYIDITSDNDYGSFTIKNISSFPLNISPEQLTERFVRGDESRSTEGSGLGLSIAQSLTALQGGKFQLEIDGDLFKVTVAFPLWTEE